MERQNSVLDQTGLNVGKIMIFVFNRTENIVGKRKNAGYWQFLHFPQCYQCPYPTGSFKVGTVWFRAKSAFDIISAIVWQPMHLTILFWSFYYLYSTQYSFQAIKALVDILVK